MGHLVDSDESNPVQIIEGQEVIVSIDDDNIENNTICFGDEAINMSVLNPNSLFEYQWYIDGVSYGIASMITNLPAGVVTVVATMNGLCETTSDSYTTSQPLQIIPMPVITEPSCYGLSDGQIDILVEGGVAPLTYQWSVGSIPLELDNNNVDAGSYDLIVTDNNDCNSDTLTIIITEPALLQSDITSTDVLCFGDNTGTAVVSVTGGTAPYSEDWLGEDPMQLSQGSYTVNITDANGCVASSEVVISQPTNLSASISLNGDQMSASASGGTPPYSYVWQFYGNQQGTSTTLDLTDDGTYTLVVTDANGCQDIDEEFYERQDETVSIAVLSGLSIQLYPNPATTYFVLEAEGLSSVTDYTVELVDVRGKIVYEQALEKQLVINTSHLAKGVYMLMIADEENIFNKKIVLK